MLGFLKTTRSFPKIPEEFRSLPKKSEVFRRRPKSSEDVRSLPKASSLPVLFTSKIRDREEGIIIYSFYTWFSFLTWVWVNIFLEIVSSKTATTHIFQSGVRNRPIRLTQCCTQFKSPGIKILCVLICIIMRHLHLNDMEIPETKRFIPKGFELGTTLC